MRATLCARIHEWAGAVKKLLRVLTV